MVADKIIFPDWPAPANVVALATTRNGLAGFAGASVEPYSHFNLGDHVDDLPASVSKNRDAKPPAIKCEKSIA